MASFLKKLGKGVGWVGDAVKKVAPVAAFVPGIGPGIAAVAGGLGGIAGTLNDEGGFNLGRGLKDGALSAVGAFGAGKLGSAVKNAGGIAGAASSLMGKIKPVAPGAPSAAQPSGSNLLGKVFDFAKQNPMAVLGGIGMISDARQNSRAAGMRDDALDLVKKKQQSDDQMRQQLMAALMGGGGIGGGAAAVPDLADMFDTGNAYDKPVRFKPVGGVA